MHWLRWADFVPASDQLLKGKITQEAQKALGIKLNVETINANDIQARVTSSVQSGTGPDIIMALNNWPQLYAASLADVGDLADEIGKEQGGYYDINKIVATVGGKWIGAAVVRRRWSRRLPQIVARRGRVCRQVSAELGRVSRRRQKTESRRSPVWANRRPHFRRRAGMVVSLSVVMGRQGGRGGWQDRRAQQQGDDRIR